MLALLLGSVDHVVSGASLQLAIELVDGVTGGRNHSHCQQRIACGGKEGEKDE